MAKKKEEGKKPRIINAELIEPKEEGVLILALGHENYLHMAENLAMSLKTNSPSIKVALAVLEGTNPHYHFLFDKIVYVQPHHITRHGVKALIQAKVYLNEITPFKRTLFLDADLIVNPENNINHMLVELNGKGFTIKNTGVQKLDEDIRENNWWVNIEKLKTAFNLTNQAFYHVSSEVMYWEEGEKSEKVFKAAQEFYKEPIVDYNPFAGSIPDELAFIVAMMQESVYPHQAGWNPSFWSKAEKRQLDRSDLFTQYRFTSAGGNRIDNDTMKVYNDLVSSYARQYGIKYPFLLNKNNHKYTWLPERTHI